MRNIATLAFALMALITAGTLNVHADDEVVYTTEEVAYSTEAETVPTTVQYEYVGSECEAEPVRYEATECETCEVEGTLPSGWGEVPW